jgi:hypothetical protein
VPVLTQSERTAAHLYMGYPQLATSKSGPAFDMDNSLDRIDQKSTDGDDSMRALVSSALVDAADALTRINSAQDLAGVRKAGSVELIPEHEIQAAEDKGRRAVARLEVLTDLPRLRDVFSGLGASFCCNELTYA